MTYIVKPSITERGQIDMPRFAADLAEALRPLIAKRPSTEAINVDLLPAGEIPRDNQSIKVGNEVLALTANNWKGVVAVSISAPDVKHEDRNYHDQRQLAFTARVNPDGRSIDAIARDIVRRVIDGNAEALKRQRERQAQMDANRASIVKHAAALRAAIPGLDVKVNERDQCASIWNKGGEYLHANMNSNGGVSVERLGTLPLATFVKLVKLINENKSLRDGLAVHVGLREPRRYTDAEFFAKEFGERYRNSVKATATKKNTFYAVCEVDAAEEDRLVADENGKVRFCVVAMISAHARPAAQLRLQGHGRVHGPGAVRVSEEPARHVVAAERSQAAATRSEGGQLARGAASPSKAKPRRSSCATA